MNRSLVLAKRLRAAAALAVLSLAVSGLAGANTTPPLADNDEAKQAMVDLETKMNDSLQSGHAVPVWFDSDQKEPGHVVGAGGWGDSGLWTGVYLGGQAMRYSVAKKHLEAAPQDEFWTAQRDEALERVETILAAEHRDINIAEDWTGELKIPPTVNTTNPTGDRHQADWGGGVIHGERGMIMRSCTTTDLGSLGINPPTNDPENPINNNNNRVFEITWTSGDGGTYYCEASPSRDTYAGLTFGLLTAFDLVGPDEPELQAQIAADLMAMGDFLVKYAWNYPRPHGYVSADHDFDGFISPLFVYVPMARLNMANAARHVAEVAGSDTDKAKWNAVWAEEFSNQGPELGPSMEVDSVQPNDGYYKFNLHHLTGFNLLRTTTGVERDLIARAFAIMDKTTGDDINAHFEAITYSATGEQSRLDAAVTHLREWLDYRANIETGAPVNNSARCGIDLECVPEDQYDLDVEQAPGGSVTWFPGAPDAPPLSESAKLRAARPLPVAQRTPTDFLWQRPPTALDGQEWTRWREPGIDYLTPYWMIRYFTEVASPTGGSFPEWAGPAHL
ncbi:MAG: hypothetical protein WDA27_14695 [Actinomycetota bacterium]